jgi:hypothetical protein
MLEERNKPQRPSIALQPCVMGGMWVGVCRRARVEAGLTHGWSATLKGGGFVGTKVIGFFNDANGCGIFPQPFAGYLAIAGSPYGWLVLRFK